ncbi:DUF397 domain-containing protein [Streptomyces pactum]|uniref:DUF397 domain-containing protein n=1 Tax=Streptomyces pactum TaxID=68249 RepID=UPI0036FA1EA4
MNIQEAPHDACQLVWFKSSYSGDEGGECVEVAVSPGTVHVRDSKDRTGPQLTFSAAEWSAFVSYVAALD